MQTIWSVLVKALMVFVLLLAVAATTKWGVLQGGLVALFAGVYAELKLLRHITTGKQHTQLLYSQKSIAPLVDAQAVPESMGAGISGLYVIELHKWVLSLGGLVLLLGSASADKSQVFLGFVLVLVVHRLVSALPVWYKHNPA